MAAWPTEAEVEARLKLPQGSADATNLTDSTASAIELVASRTNLPADEAIPHPVRLATLMYAVKFYRRQNTPDGIAGTSDDLVTLRTNRYDGDAEQLLEPYLHVPHA